MKTVLLFLLISPAILWAQSIKITPEDVQRKQSYLLMRDGLVVQGRILRQDSLMITVRKRGGELSFIETDQIVRISPVRPDVPPNTVEVRPGTTATVFVLRDSSRVEGKYVRRDSTMITVRKRNGQLTYFEPELLIRVDTIQAQAEMTQASALAGDTFPNRFSPWLLTGQTAYNPEKGRFYYRNIFLLLNELHYGLTRNLSVGLHVNPFFGSLKLDNNARQPVFGATVRFSSKLTFPIGEQFRVGVHVTYQPKQRGYFSALPQQLTLQEVMSFGNSQRNATLGYGLRLYPDFSSASKTAFVTAGVMHKISRGLTFLSDNTFYLNSSVSGNSAELSVALRFDRRRHAFDLGALALVQPYYFYNGPRQSETRAYFSPYIGYNLIIGRD